MDCRDLKLGEGRRGGGKWLLARCKMYLIISVECPLSSFKGGLAAGGLKGWMQAPTALFVPLTPG